MAVIKKFKAVKNEQGHLLGIQDLSISEVYNILEQAKTFIALNKSASKKMDILRGKTQIKIRKEGRIIKWLNCFVRIIKRYINTAKIIKIMN